MAFTAEDVEALERAIADGRGAKTMTFGDQSVTFNSIADMLALRDKMLGIVAAEEAAATGTSRTRFAATSKGV
jgi:hypothetical protein